MLRVLVLLAALLSMPARAADDTPWPDAEAAPAGIELLAQATTQGQGQSQGGQSKTERYPGDYCTRHCRRNEIPCGDGCVANNANAKCTAKKTTTCGGRP